MEYEGVLQLRPFKKEIMDFIKEETLKAGKANIVKIEAIKEGIDVYFDRKSWLLALWKKLRYRWPGLFKFTKKLHTMRDGRLIHRVTLLFRPANFRIGDEFEFKDEKFKVLKIEGKKVLVRNLRTKEKTRIDFEKVEKIFRF